MSSANEVRFSKLKGRDNYDTWRMAAKSFLVIKGYWSCILKEPTTGKTDEAEKDLKAWSELNLLLDESIYSYIADTDTAKKAWDALESAFQDSGLCRKVHLLKQLVQLKLEECVSIEDYVNKMMTTSLKVKKSGLKLDDEVTASLLLAGLPENFDPLVMAVENSGKTLTIDGVRTLLLQETRLETSTSGDRAFFNKAKKKQQNSFKCHACGTIGHFAKNCPDKSKGKTDEVYAVL